MKKLLLLIPMMVIMISCGSEGLTITVENPSGFDRLTEMVEIPLADVIKRVPLEEGLALVVKNSDGEIVASQLTSESVFIFQAGVKANSSATYKMVTVPVAEQPDYKRMVFGRFFPERKDDYAWENDRVAFRVYGPALIETDGPSNGIDVWYKRTNDMVVEKWYKASLENNISYHKDHGEGQDDYKVGRSLGAGAMAPYVGEKLWLNENFVNQQTLDNGPLRFSAKFTYDELDVNGKLVPETRTVVLDAGSQYTKVIQEYPVGHEMEVAAGIVKRDGSDYIKTDNYVIYTNVENADAGEAYIGVVFPSGIKYTKEYTYVATEEGPVKGKEYSHMLVVADYPEGDPMVYYTGYGWHKFGFADAEAFSKYTAEFVEAVNNPLVVKY